MSGYRGRPEVAGVPSERRERAQLAAALDYNREGDTLVVTKLDRLARSARHLSELVDGLEAKGVTLRILNFGGDPVDTTGATGRLILNMFAAMAQFEREMMLERQREGIAKAKAEGKYKGRKPTARAKAEDAVQMFRDGRRVAHIAKNLGIGRGSVYRPLRPPACPKKRMIGLLKRADRLGIHRKFWFLDPFPPLGGGKRAAGHLGSRSARRGALASGVDSSQLFLGREVRA